MTVRDSTDRAEETRDTENRAELASPASAQGAGHDEIVLRWWFLFYGITLGALCVALSVLLSAERADYSSWAAFQVSVREMASATKLVLFATYMMICCTFLPLNTSWLVAAVAMQDVAVADSLLGTMLLVATVGAAASTIANLNDYHLFTLLLRTRHVGRVRDARWHERAGRWFDRQPFGLLLVFNIVPIPVDVARMLAATRRYPRLPFAAANFLGRFLRYAIIAAVTYALGKQGWVAVVALLGLAVVLAVGRWIARGRANRTNDEEKGS